MVPKFVLHIETACMRDGTVWVNGTTDGSHWWGSLCIYSLWVWKQVGKNSKETASKTEGLVVGEGSDAK